MVSGSQASQLSFNNAGTLSPTAQWSADPSQDGVGTITLTSPAGSTTDLVATNAIQSGEIARLSADARQYLAASAEPARSDGQSDVAGLVEPDNGRHRGHLRFAVRYSVDIGGLSAGNSVQLTYTNAQNVQKTVSIVALGAGGTLPSQTSGSNSQTVGVDLSAGMSSVVAQLNAALGSNLQFSNPSGTVLQVLNASGGNTVTSLSATSTATSLTSGTAQLPLFTDGDSPITGAITASGSQTTGLAGRIEVNAALVSSPGSLVAYSSNTAAGDTTRRISFSIR